MVDLFRIAEQEGIYVEYCNLPLNKSISAQDRNGQMILMDMSLISKQASERTHFSHELAHCVTGSFYNPYAPLDIRQKHENKANKWAIEHCISVDALDEAVSDGCTEWWQLSERFGVTEDFVKKAVCWYTYGNVADELYF